MELAEAILNAAGEHWVLNLVLIKIKLWSSYMDMQYLSPCLCLGRLFSPCPNLIGKVALAILSHNLYGPGGGYGAAQQNPRTLAIAIQKAQKQVKQKIYAK